jgi:hypothetical protein
MKTSGVLPHEHAVIVAVGHVKREWSLGIIDGDFEGGVDATRFDLVGAVTVESSLPRTRVAVEAAAGNNRTR